MNPITWRTRIGWVWGFVRHPIHAAGAWIAFRYCERNDLVIERRARYNLLLNRWKSTEHQYAAERMPCTCGPNEGCSSCP